MPHWTESIIQGFRLPRLETNNFLEIQQAAVSHTSRQNTGHAEKDNLSITEITGNKILEFYAVFV